MTTDKSHKDLAIEAANRREYARKYYQANKDKARKYYKKHDVLIKARAALWRLQNRERYLEQQRFYDANKRLYPQVKDARPSAQKGVKKEGPPYNW